MRQPLTPDQIEALAWWAWIIVLVAVILLALVYAFNESR